MDNLLCVSDEEAGVYSYWDTKASPEDMEELWSHPEVLKEWTKSGEIRGKTCLCALAEVVSLRFVNGVGPRTGIMGIDYSTAFWLYMELGYRAYRVDSADDLTKPFVSMYFGAAYLVWLTEYEGRERTPQFVVQAYISGPKNVNLQETGPLRLKFMQALGNYEDIKEYASSHFLIEIREFSVLMTYEFFFFSVGIKGTAPFCKR
nr:hypothetical protein CFP56_01621 [Quercus suber]